MPKKSKKKRVIRRHSADDNGRPPLRDRYGRFKDDSKSKHNKLLHVEFRLEEHEQRLRELERRMKHLGLAAEGRIRPKKYKLVPKKERKVHAF